MTDGPFRNAELPANWKRYGKDLVNDATSEAERVARVSRNIVTDAGADKVSRVVRALKAEAQKAQLNLDPAGTVAAVFEAQPGGDALNFLQRHINANLRDKVPLDTAIDSAMVSSVKDLIQTTKNRIDEECILARDQRREMTSAEYDKGIRRNREAFGAVDADAISRALTFGDKKAFKADTQRKTDIDNDGPK